MIYLTAHRVVSPTTDEEGINAFRYTSGNYTWEGPAPAPFDLDEDPGVLVGKRVSVPPPGNHVRSYLDIVAPADVALHELRGALAAAADGDAPERLPAEWSSGRVWLRFGAERALLPFWRTEMRRLFDSAAPLMG